MIGLKLNDALVIRPCPLGRLRFKRLERLYHRPVLLTSLALEVSHGLLVLLSHPIHRLLHREPRLDVRARFVWVQATPDARLFVRKLAHQTVHLDCHRLKQTPQLPPLFPPFGRLPRRACAVRFASAPLPPVSTFRVLELTTQRADRLLVRLNLRPQSRDLRLLPTQRAGALALHNLKLGDQARRHRIPLCRKSRRHRPQVRRMRRLHVRRLLLQCSDRVSELVSHPLLANHERRRGLAHGVLDGRVLAP